MTTRKKMGDAAKALFGSDAPVQPKTGAAALTAILSEAPTEPILPTEPKKEEPTKFAVTTFRLKQEQWEALRIAAIKKAKVKGGKADASEVLRDILDQWMAS